MSRKPRFRTTLLAPLAGFALLAGCRMFEQQPARPAPAAPAPEATAKLSRSQVADVQIGLGRSLEVRGEAERAESAYREAIKSDPTRADAYLRLAGLRDRQARFDESAELYRKALAAKPGNPDAYCNVGYSFYLQRRWDLAEANLRQAIALRPDHQRAHNNLGLVLGRLGRDEDALNEFRRGGCTEAAACSNLAFSLTLERRWPDARLCYERALELEPALACARKGIEQLDALTTRTGLAAQTPANDRGPGEEATLPDPTPDPSPAEEDPLPILGPPRGLGQ